MWDNAVSHISAFKKKTSKRRNEIVANNHSIVEIQKHGIDDSTEISFCFLCEKCYKTLITNEPFWKLVILSVFCIITDFMSKQINF